jgi:2,3-bisphosphoglycerate-independent phosphoglycerate mutase
MKYAMVLPDGAADEPLPELDGRTPLQAARKPHMDRLAAIGRQGLVVTIPEGFAMGSDVATLSLFGYDPRLHYPGRAPLEAAARGITAKPDELMFRCNLVTMADGIMEDFTAGHISQQEADRLVSDLNEQLSEDGCTFHAGSSYRHLMILSNVGDLEPITTPPQHILGQAVAPHWPSGFAAERLRSIMKKAHSLLEEHVVNAVRRDLGENPATDIWLWGQGRSRGMEAFASRFGVSGAVVAAVDLVRGIARCVELDVVIAPGATGFLDTNYASKGAAAAAALDECDLVIVHIAAPDEAGHLGDAGAKVLAIEQIDEHVVGPVLQKLSHFDSWRMLVAPDHPTPVHRRVHTAEPPPFCIAASEADAGSGGPFCEEAAAQSGWRIDPGHGLMEYFLMVSDAARSAAR